MSQPWDGLSEADLVAAIIQGATAFAQVKTDIVAVLSQPNPAIRAQAFTLAGDVTGETTAQKLTRAAQIAAWLQAGAMPA